MRVIFGAVTLTAPASVIDAEEFNVTELLPVTAALRATVVPAAVLADNVTSYPVNRPAVAMLPAEAFKVNVLPAVAPELLALRVMVPALPSVMFTRPLVLALSVLVATEPAVILPEPELKLTVPPVKVPAVWVIVPVPVAVTVTVFVAMALAPNAMLPLTAVD